MAGPGQNRLQPRHRLAVSPTPTPTTPTQAEVGLAMSKSVSAATSFHVAGQYTYPHARLTLNVGLLKSGPMAGSLVDNGEPIVATYVGGKMYTKVTRGFLAYLGKSRECRTICGQYVIARPDLARGLLASMGFASTESILLHMAAGAARDGAGDLCRSARLHVAATGLCRRLLHRRGTAAAVPATQGRCARPVRPDLQPVEPGAEPRRPRPPRRSTRVGGE